MPTMNATDYRIIYFPDEVVLLGDTRKIHTEAYKILMRYKHCPKSYYIKKDSDHKIVLSARHN